MPHHAREPVSCESPQGLGVCLQCLVLTLLACVVGWRGDGSPAPPGGGARLTHEGVYAGAHLTHEGVYAGARLTHEGVYAGARLTQLRESTSQ